MAGCGCDYFKEAVVKKIIRGLGNDGWFITAATTLNLHINFNVKIHWCPWCGARLTPPEEASDE